MPKYIVNGKTYNIPDDKVTGFESKYPDATVEYHNEGKTYQIPLSKRDGFLKQFPNASYSETTAQEAKQPEQPATPVSTTAEEPEVEAAAQPALTEQDKIRFSAGIEQMKRRTAQSMDEFNERMETMREYHDNAPLGGGQTAEGRVMYNPQSGKFEKTYITPLGNRYTSKGLADMESFRYRQAADMSVSGQLRKARLKLAELKEERAAAGNRAHEKAQEFNKKNLTLFGQLTVGGDIYRNQMMSDPESNAYDVAIRQTEELIKDLEEQADREQGIDVGFWRGFGRTVSDFRTWDLGMSDMRDAMTMMYADGLNDENATEGERAAYNEMMGALYNKEQAEQAYGGNASFWNRAGVMTGYMPSFMLDFAITGGGFEGVNLLAKGGTKAATKVVGKEVVEEMAAQGFKTYVKNNGVKGFGQYATNWTIKALGTMGDDLLVRAPLMTNTVQFGKTTSDIIDRKLGDVVVNEDGTYDFSNDKTWGSAIWQGEANAIIENYSEMFGAHLDPVVTFGNMGKLANVVGAKRIGAVLSKADAGTLSGIMGQTHQLFNKMGVSDYFGEVTEEYYGQMWRTMLNLDDAYQQNPDGSRTNLLATGQFHGDIWGGMALSMGLMGAGKHTLSGAQYVSMKHGVNKADAHATELLGKEVWEPLRATIDLTTNDDIGSVAEGIVNDKDFTDDERAAILTYMERSLMMRGFNLGTLASKRGGEQDEDVQAMDESYIDGYNINSAQEMTDAKNMYEYQRQRVEALVDEDLLAFMDSNPMNALEEVRSNGVWNEEARATILDYLNAKQVYNGMIQRVRDDIDGRIDQSNAMVDARTNRTTGMIQGAVMKQDDRRVYVVAGNLVPFADGSGIDNSASDGTIIVRDAETGALEQVSPEAVLNIDKPLNPAEEKMTAAEAIRQQYAQEAADKIDGVVTFNPGDTYTITGDDAQIQVQVVANEQGIVDNGDGTVNVSDGTNVFPLSKETIQQQVEQANLARVAQFEQQRAAENAEKQQAMQEANRPQYSLNDVLSLTDENGVTVRGSITADADADGRFEVYTEAPINGKRVNLFNRDELDNMLLEHNGVAFERPAEVVGNNGEEIIPENGNNAPQNIPAMQRIPKDEQGNPIYEQTDSDTAWDAIVEQTEGDEAMAQTVADGMVADKETALKKLEKAKSKGGTTIAEKINAEKERKSAIDAAKEELVIWQKIAGTANRRKMDAEAERRRIADEAVALRKAEEEKLRAEREEAERIEREALNGVPDMVDDKPQDARARGYRRVSGHKIDRQEPLQALQGKEIAVKFSDSTLPTGRVAVIEAEQLQPSHVQGVRNPLHFIDEAQPKERNDEASVLSAQKIAGNIRPEEITSSVTAYTGAPTVNARGEAIQGNNRSDALRLMWESHQEQAAKYKQYLMDHAEEFGLNAEDIAGMQHPVLVNMLDVEDADAITLGQFVAQDTESGGVERIKPKNALLRMGVDMRSFANLLLKSADDETSFAGLVDSNGVEVLKWMSQKGYITPTQYRSAFDSKGNLTAEAKNDLRGIMYQSIFKGGSTRLEEMFNALPAKAQKAILATAFRDYDSPSAERMIEEIQNSVRAFYALSQSADFVEAKTYKDARLAVEAWKIQYQIDDVTGESYLPAENFSNFALLLATMYKGENQSIIQGTFNRLYDLIQGTQEANLFEQPDNTPRTLAQAINETLNITYNGQQRSNVLVGDSSASQRGQQGSTGNAATGERIESGERTADSAGSIEAESTTGGEAVHQPQPERKGLEQTSDVGRKGNRTGVADDATQEVLGASNRSDLRVFEEGLDTSYSAYSDDSERTRRTAESERLVNLAKQHGLFIPAEVIKTLTGKVAKRTGESVVYIDTAAGKVTKVKDPYAKAAMKSGVQPEDAAFEHRVHNLLFPETAYTLEGISEEMGDVRIVLSQDFIQNYDQPTKEQIAEALAARGLFPEDNYSFGNELVSVTDVEGDNVLLGEDGTVYFIDPIIRFKKPLREIRKALGGNEQQAPTIGEQVQAAEAEVNTAPTDKQKEAGNYKKGHVQIGTFNVTIEQPRGSVRSGVDKGGKKWEVEMKNTYGYIRGTEGVDGDHIDVFLSNDIDGWNGRQVYVIDQRNADGSFDEHKVMLGFNDINEAEEAYLSNYEQGWQGLGAITGVAIEDFEKWIASSHRKTKAFAEYKSVKTTEGQSASADLDKRQNLAKFNVGDVVRDYYDHKLYRIKKHSTNGVSTIAELDAEGNEVRTTTMNAHNNSRYSIAETPTISQDTDQVSDQVSDAAYSIAPAQYTTKKGKVLDMHLVKFTGELTKEQQRAAKELAKADKGWYDREQGGFMMRSEESAKQLADTILGNEEAVSEAQPVSMTDIQALNNGDVLFTEPQQVEQTDSEEKSPVWQYSIHVDKETGRTTLRRDDVSGVYPIGDARWQHTAASPEEMLDILRNPLNGMQDVLEAVGVTLENKIKTRELDRKSKEQAPTAETNPSGNRLVTDERYAELRERMRKKLGGQMNIGIDPEILAIGTEMAVYHLEKGARKFTEFAKAMIADLGDVIRPYLKAFYNGARNLPEVESSEIAADMSSYDEVQTIDVANFDKPGIDALATAETVAREAEVEQEVEIAQERIKKTRSVKNKSVNSQQEQLNLFDNGTEGENTRTGNSGTELRPEELSDTQQVGSGTSVQDSASNSKGKRRNIRVGGSELGNRPKYDVNKSYTNEEIGEIVSSVTDIVDGKVVITGEVTDDIKAICRQYKSGGVAKKGRGILDEYYTDGKIVDAVRMLIAPYFNANKPVRVLEPSVGVGNFIEAARELQTSDVVAFEINDTTARIAKVLYPNVDVNLRSFETEFIDDEGKKKPLPQKYNLVIGNPPYGSHRGLYKGLGEESKIARYEDYFVKRSLDVLEDGGVLAMVLPSSWIDRHTTFGGYTIEAAYRLPSGAFEATQVGTDIVVLKKDSSIPVSEHTPYFELHSDRILGEVKERKGRYGKMEEYVQGDIDVAIDAIEREHAKQIAEQLDIEATNDNLNDIQTAIEETGSADKAKTIVESEKKVTADKKPAPKASGKQGKYKVELNRGAETLPTSSQFTHEFSEGEVEAFEDTDYNGTINNPTKHRKYANFIGGKAVHDFYYAEGDIYSKLSQLEIDKPEIVEKYGIEQYEKQKRLLESVLPKRKDLDEITISPNTTFVKNLNVSSNGEAKSLKELFIDFCRKLPYGSFGDSSTWEVIGYVNNEQVHGTDKQRNQLIRERRKRVANDLFVKFLNDELSDEAKKQVVLAFNREYNSVYRPDYSRVPMFSTINKDFKGKPLKLTSVQLAGIGRMTVKGVGVLAHEVGFGKTLSGILAMHEAMTRGFAKKPLIVVPNDNILKQWVETIKEVLPSATVNMLGNLGTSYDLTDFEVNDGEFTIVTYEGLKAMSFSDDTYNQLADRFSYITEDLKKHQSERDIQKEIEKHNELKGKMRRGAKTSYGFEEFGFDWLTFDEVHNANHIVSKVRLDKSVASDFRSQSQRTSDLGLKTWLAAQYIQDLNNGRNVLLLSATPFTNKPLEYYSILSLVGNDMLRRKGFFNVDQFFATFMEADNDLEIGANGRPVQKTNVRRFRNNGLFQQLLSEFIDIKGEEDNPELVRPERSNKEYKIAQNDLTAEAMGMAQELLSDNDTVLQGIGHARAAAFSPYATSLLGAQPKNHREFVKNSPKIEATIKMIEQNKKDRPDAGQIIYSEVGVEYFPLIRDYLVKESGFKPNEVRIITGATSNNERVNIQSSFNDGEVKVVIGSPAIKEGLNLQGNTTDMYILSLPWNFTQLRQIEGRGWRQGNKWKNIRINYMLTNDSVDVFMLQRLQLKQGLYNEAMKSGAESLDVSDIDTSELKTALITDPAVRAEIVTVQEKAKLQQEKTQIEADLSFVMRKYEGYNKLIEKLNSQKTLIKQYKSWIKEDNDYWASRVKHEENILWRIENDIEQEKNNLLKKGVNVDDIVRQTEQSQEAIKGIQERIDNLHEYQDELTEKFRKEREAIETEQGDLLAAYLKERKAENKSGFYMIRPTQSEQQQEDDDTLYRSDDAIKNRIEALFNQAISGEFKGKPISIGRLTDEGKAYLEQISGVVFKEYVDFVLNPSDLMHIYKDHFGNNEKDKGQNIPLDIEDIRSLVDVISSPDKVVLFKEGEGSNRNMFYFFKEAEDGTYNLMEIYSDRKGNLTAKTFYKTRKDATQRVMDIEKSLLPTSETYSGAILSDAKIPQMFESASVEDDFSARDGDGAYTDDEVSFENDPISKVLGKPRFTHKQRREFAERERQRMVARVENLAKKLNLDNVEIVTDASTLEGKKQRANGFYTKSTGKITIVIPNHSSTFDVEQTLLHEAVAHYGLRQLFGEHFDTFLDNVFNNADESIRKRISELAIKKYKFDFRKATEEYLAMLAENTEFENTNASWWRQIKDFFLNMLHKIGFEDFGGVTLTDNELRYILWRSYENLAEPGKYRSILGEAADVAKQYELGVGNYAVTNPNTPHAAESDDELYRDGTTLREEYDRKVRVPNKSGSVKWNENLPYRMKESYQDSMAALKTLQDLISEETGNQIQSHENAYMAENRMSSENKAQAEIYERDFYNPLRKAVQALIKAGSSYEDLKSYIIAKHGLERNEYMRTQAEQNGEDSDRDFAGLTALTGMDNVADAEAEAQRIVDDYEQAHDTADLWEKINAATKETLRKSYDSGLMDKATYEKVRDMYEYYVPLRGWDCEVASSEYEYLTSNKLMLSPALKVAKGRTSLADDPLATIGFMAESSIVQGNRNKMKQKFLNFILNNETDLVSVSEQWYVLDNATGEWEARNPIIPDNATGDEVAAIVEQFEQEMEALGDKATKKRDGLKLSMNITKREGQEHVVRVKRNGKEYCLYINGSPRAAQAINGLTNPDVNDGSLYRAAKAVKHWMASMFTSKNPAFIATNLSRDVIWAGTAVAIKENAAYTARYTKNVSECLLKAQLPRLLVKFKNGTLDMNNELERYFDEFIRNGGETGFTQLNTVEDYKRNIKRFVKEAQGKGSITQKAWNGLWNSVEFLNRSAEDTTRFMVYMTSRQMGRDMARSIYDAKEITVNFNKKGSGGLGASVMNFSYIFFNATIQSLANFGKLMAKHPAKTTIALTLFSSAGFLVPMLNLAIQAMLGGDDDDENSYWDLPEWVRRNNIVLYVPWSENGYITIPLPHEMRPFYGMGEIAYSCLMDKENVEDGLQKSLAGFSALLPIDLTGNGGNVAVNLTPTIGQPFAQIVANTDYFGKPIYKKHEWNERYPEWTKAYKGTAPWLVDGTRWLNELGGGDNVKSGGLLFDWNPALIEHLFESYLGGVGKTINKSQKTLEMLWNEDLREWRNVPVVSSFYQTAEERTAGSQINREYYNAVDEMKDAQHLFSGYKREIRMGNIEYAEKVNELINSEVFKRYALVKGYDKAIKKASDALKVIEDPTKREDVETMIMNLKVEMLEKLEDLEERK